MTTNQNSSSSDTVSSAGKFWFRVVSGMRLSLMMMMILCSSIDIGAKSAEVTHNTQIRLDSSLWMRFKISGAKKDNFL